MLFLTISSENIFPKNQNTRLDATVDRCGVCDVFVMKIDLFIIKIKKTFATNM